MRDYAPLSGCTVAALGATDQPFAAPHNQHYMKWPRSPPGCLRRGAARQGVDPCPADRHRQATTVAGIDHPAPPAAKAKIALTILSG